MFQKYKLEGTPYEIGHQHGKLAKDKITNSIIIYKEMFKTFANLDWQSAYENVEKYIPFIESFDVDIMEEIRGIADGSGYELNDILILNARSELMFSTQMLEGCTSFATTPEISGGKLFVGQNWDWGPGQKDSVVIFEIEQKNKPNILMITEAGLVGKIGFNSSGVSICLNALMTNLNRPGTPLHIVMRGVLNSWNFDEAMAKVANSNIASAVNFIIGYEDESVANIEVIPDDFEVILPENGIITHTNHITSSRLLTKVDDLIKDMHPDTVIRFERSIELFLEAGEVDIDKIKNVLSDHFNYPNSICRHEDPQMLESEQLCTVFSMIINLKSRELHLTEGKPCESKYERITFEK